MKRILMRRYPREIKTNLFRYLSLFLMIALCMYIIIALVDAAEIIIQGTEKNQIESCLEDGQLTVFTPFTNDQIKMIEDKGVTIEDHRSFDIDLDDGSVMRVFANREKIDKVALDDGRLAQNPNEVVLEKRYCEEHGITEGDKIRIAGEDYLVTGIGSAVDYDAPYRKMSDMAVDSRVFGLAFVTGDEYIKIRDSKSAGSEEITYAFLLNDKISSDDLKDMIKDFEFDYKKVEDPFYKEMLEDSYGKKDDITEGIDDLVDGVDELYDGAGDLADGTGGLKDGMKEIYDGSVDLYDGTKELKKGTHDLSDGMSKIKSGTKQLNDALEEITKNNDALKSGADQIFDSVLAMTNQSLNGQLKQMGMDPVKLTRKNYADVLGKIADLIDGMGGSSKDIRDLKASLDKMAQFVSGTKSYVDAVGKVSEGGSTLYKGTKDAASGAKELDDGAKELKNGTAELKDGIKEAYDGSIDLDEGANELLDGVKELKDGVKELKDKSDDLLDEVFSTSPDNITSFLLKEDNLRVGGASDDIEINKTVGLVAGVIVLILFAYVLSVFVIHQINNESSVIGALYALGLKKKDLMAHYITLPTLVAFLGGIIGTVVGLSGFGSEWQMSDSYAYYSLPSFDKIIPPYLIIYAVIMPPLVSLIVNYIVINKSLSRTALSLMRNDQKTVKGRDVNLKDMAFMPKFKLRQMLREKRTAVTVIAGMMISLLIFMMGADCYVLCVNVGKYSAQDTHYAYMYSYKYPSKEAPEGGEALYVESLKKESNGYTMDISIMGIDSDNPYIDVHPQKGKNKITLSDAVAGRYGVGIGDKFVLSDTASDVDLAFTVADIVPYNVGLTVFMDIDSMRDLFGQGDDYFNAVMSDNELDIDAGRLYSVTSKEDIDRSSSIFTDLMGPMVSLLLTMSVIIFCIVMYLMTTVMVDRAKLGISLFKILGFSEKEVKKLYLDGNRIVVAIGAVIAIPVAKFIMDSIFPMFIANVCCPMHIEFPWYYYLVIFAGIMICYSLISLLITAKLKKVTPAEVLKNRE